VYAKQRFQVFEVETKTCARWKRRDRNDLRKITKCIARAINNICLAINFFHTCIGGRSNRRGWHFFGNLYRINSIVSRPWM